MTAEVQTFAILRAFITFGAEGLERFTEKNRRIAGTTPRPGLAGTRPQRRWLSTREERPCEHDHLRHPGLRQDAAGGRR